MPFPISHNNFSADLDRNTNGQTSIAIRNQTTGKVLRLLDAAKCRQWLVGAETAKMTLNAAVRIIRFASQQVAGTGWQMPTDLNGTTADWNKIVTDEVIAAIALLQANAGLDPDGMPGGQFVGTVMKLIPEAKTNATRFLMFMDESNNHNMIDEFGSTISVPDRNSEDQDEVYRFCRSMVLNRNGLWSDVPGITNLCGLRYRKSDAPRANSWNDILAVCWIDMATQQRRVETFLATTEPGMPRLKPTVPAQTFLVRPGYHHAQLPGGRSACIMAKDQFNRNLKYDPTDSRGINFHPGGNTVKSRTFQKVLPGGLVKTDAEFARQLVWAEIFAILSRWGMNPNVTAYTTLRKYAEIQPVQISSANGNSIDLVQGSRRKTLSVGEIRKWLVRFWLVQKRNTEALFTILRGVDAFYNTPSANAEAIAQSITAAHIESIVRTQTQYFMGLDDIDGLAGPKFLGILSGGMPNLTELASAAQADWARMQAIETTSTFTNMQRNNIRNMCMDTLGERQALANANLPRLKVGEIPEEVKGWSIACQVIYGTEAFYKFWLTLTANTMATGQRQWYYSLLERNSF